MASTEIIAPAEMADKCLIKFFQSWKWVNYPTGPTSFNFEKTNFIAPWGICLFASYALWLSSNRGKKVKIKYDLKTRTGRYIATSGMLDVLKQEIDTSNIESRDIIAKLTLIQRSDEIPVFVNKVMEMLQLEDEEIAGAVKYSLVELLRNVVQHSHSRFGGLAIAQYFPSTGLVELVVADGGVGIRETLNSKYPEIDNDFKAVKFATQPHVSGTFKAGAYSEMKENAGLGLFFIKQIASLSGGGFFLGSGKVLSDIWGDNEGNQKKMYKTTSKSGWKGTFALLQLRKDSIGDFDAVLHTCRKLAEEARKDPSTLNLDFIEEIPDIDELEVIQVAAFEEDVEKASVIRDEIIEVSLANGKLVVLDFTDIKFATQSFIHALIYKLLRDSKHISTGLSIANCTGSTREAILAVAGYAKTSKENGKDIL